MPRPALEGAIKNDGTTEITEKTSTQVVPGGYEPAFRRARFLFGFAMSGAMAFS